MCDFEYPVSIAEPLRKKMALWLRKISNPQEAQQVLNYFAQCLLKNTIRDPFVYFITLVRRFLNGELFLSESDKHSPQQQKETRQANQYKNELQEAYRDAFNDYQHMKNAILREAKAVNASFQDYLASSSVHQLLWKQVVDKLKEVTP